MSSETIAQNDTAALKEFIIHQKISENKFIEVLKANKIDSCLTFFSQKVVRKYGSDSLRKEMKKLHNFFLKYPTPVNTPSIGKSSYGVGAFGHDNDETFELKSLYQFMDKDSVVYYFCLYYSNKYPTKISFYDSDNFDDSPFLMQIRTKAPLLVQPKRN